MKPKAALTLIEVLISVSLLSIGIVAVYKPLLNSLSVLSYVEVHSEAGRLASNFLWILEEKVRETGSFSIPSETGSFTGQTRTYQYRLISRDVGSTHDLHEITLLVSWDSGGLTRQMSRMAYLMVPPVS